MIDIVKIGNQVRIDRFISSIDGKMPLFICVLGNTETAKIPGISAAGANPEITDFTPAADVEYLMYGKCKCIDGVPVTPNGIPTPGIITKTSLDLSGIPLLVAVGGLRVLPKTPYIEFGGKPGKDISTGWAVEGVKEVFENARLFGEMISKTVNYLVMGESIAGGTTTALGVLTAMGYDASEKISSSLPVNPINIKKNAIVSGMKAKNLTPGDLKNKPLEAIEALGDPMQAVHAGIVYGASKRVPILLAGGTQMAAILAILNAIDPSSLERIAIGTTMWIISDEKTDLKGIVDQINPNVPILAANLNFSQIKHNGLNAYEQGVVKEGVGAGGVAIACMLSSKGKISIAKIQEKIQENYEVIIKYKL